MIRGQSQLRRTSAAAAEARRRRSFGFSMRRSKAAARACGSLGGTSSPVRSCLRISAGPPDGGGHDGKAVQHAFEEHHPERLVPAWHHLDVGGPVPRVNLAGKKPARELDLVTVTLEPGEQPAHLDGRPRSMPSDQHEAGVRSTFQDKGDRREQLPDALAVQAGRPGMVELRGDAGGRPGRAVRQRLAARDFGLTPEVGRWRVRSGRCRVPRPRVSHPRR